MPLLAETEPPTAGGFANSIYGGLFLAPVNERPMFQGGIGEGGG